MKKILIPAVVVLAAVIVSPIGAADGPFPSPKVGKVFVAAQTVTTDGAMSNFFAPGSTVVFRAYAVDAKTHRILTTKAVKYFYAKIPGAPNVKMRYTPKAKAASGRWAWTGAWKIPANYTLGIVNFRVLVTTKTKRQGAFRQVPVSAAQLTITNTPQLPPGPPPSSSSTAATASLDIALYADTVNGAGAGGASDRVHADQRVQARRGVRRYERGDSTSRAAPSSPTTTSTRRTSAFPASARSTSTGERTGRSRSSCGRTPGTSPRPIRSAMS